MLLDFFRFPLRFPKTWGLLLAVGLVNAVVTGKYATFAVSLFTFAMMCALPALLDGRLRVLGLLPRACIVVLGLCLIAWGITGLFGLHGSVVDVVHSVFFATPAPPVRLTTVSLDIA
jgi:MFS superfamily sulfate permease-like transporter